MINEEMTLAEAEAELARRGIKRLRARISARFQSTLAQALDSLPGAR